MIHFTTHTYLTLAANESAQKMWRDMVPQFAHQYDFLRHALLACTALHMAHLNSVRERELLIKAGTHQDHAMPLFRVSISSLKDETCDAVLIFARQVGITAFALDERVTVIEEKEDKLPSWLVFIRSGCECVLSAGISVAVLWARRHGAISLAYDICHALDQSFHP